MPTAQTHRTNPPPSRTNPPACTRHAYVYVSMCMRHVCAYTMCLYVMACAQAKAQHNELYLAQIDSLEAHLRLAYNQEWTAKRQEYTYKLKGAWTKYVPTVGLNFGLPSVSWSPNTIFETGNAKRQLKAKIQSLDLEYTNRLNKAIADLRIDHKKAQIQLQMLAQEQDVLQLKAQIFEITEKQNQANEILPAEYLSKKLEFQTARAQFQKHKSELQIQILEIYKSAYYNLPNIQIFYTPNENCILLHRN